MYIKKKVKEGEGEGEILCAIVCYFLINRKVLCKVINKYYVFAVTNTATAAIQN